jgi:hypothetical protein
MASNARRCVAQSTSSLQVEGSHCQKHSQNENCNLPEMREVAGFVGGRSRTRTCDPLIKSQLLYQLSYAPGLLRLVIAKRRGLAKAIATVQPRP